MLNDDDFEKSAKIRKKRRVKKSDLNKEKIEQFIVDEKEWPSEAEENILHGRIVEVQKRYAFIAQESKDRELQTEELFLAQVAKRHLLAQRQERNFITVGDRVLCKIDQASKDDTSRCTIEYRGPRTNKLSRKDPMWSTREHVIATNIDQLVIVASYLNPQVKWRLIDRYLVEAELEGIPVVILLNKKDLHKEKKDPAWQKEIDFYIKLYQSLGYSVVSTQANKDQRRVPKILSQVFKDKISLVSGHSGVGKSSIVNLLEPELYQVVEEEEILKKGRHTTTFASLLKIAIGGFIIDTPGIRSFEIQDYDATQLSYGFAEFRPYLSSCKYRECHHQSEPGCAILAKIAEGKISQQRYDSYLYMLSDQGSTADS